MRKLIVSLKPTSVFFAELSVRAKKIDEDIENVVPHFEISFTEMKDFKKFVKNIDLLASIIKLKPNSIYELAKYLEKDVGNISRIVNYFHEYEVIELEEMQVNGRTVKKPTTPYNKIEFDLAS